MTFGSLFSGIGGIDLGLERAGMECRWQVECDPFCQDKLEKHWPRVARYGDIRKISGSDLEYVDVLAGGFPCQDVSLAGERAGIEEGTRSGLWFEFARIIGELRPRFVLIENFPGVLANGPMRRVLGDLSALGFDAEWDCLSACQFGAPHPRERVFIVAYPNGESKVWPAEPWAERHSWAIEPRMARVANGIPNRMDRVRVLGNAVVPQVAEWVGRQIMRAA